VFSTSSITWCGFLSRNTYENNVSRITENVLDVVLERAPPVTTGIPGCDGPCREESDRDLPPVSAATAVSGPPDGSSRTFGFVCSDRGSRAKV